MAISKITNSGIDVPVDFNRTSTDGDIAIFQKDGTTVGSIGVVGGHPHIASASGYLGIGGGTGSPFMYSYANALYPTTDNYRDLGTSGNRFKNLYLSGGVYLGGTGSANYLDDYEEGTFTPTFTASSSNPTISYDTQLGNYQKIGNTVYFQIHMATGSVSGGSGDLYISGFPFTSSSSKGSRSGALGLNYSWNSNLNPASWWMNQGTSFLYLYFNDNAANIITTSHMVTSGGNRVWVQGFYTTDA